MKLQDLFEDVAIDPIEQIIQRAGYSYEDKVDGTEGLCGTFALALYAFLNKRGFKPDICLFLNTYQSKRDDHRMHDDTYWWSHVVIKVGRRYYDITGRVTPAAVHTEFGTDTIVVVSEQEARKEIGRVHRLGGASYSRRHRNQWSQSLDKR